MSAAARRGVWRRADGPTTRHPVTVVPDDPGRRGALVRVRGWEIAVADPTAQIGSLDELDEQATRLGWRDDIADDGGPPFREGLVGFITDDVSAGLLGLPQVDVRPGPAPVPPVWFGRYDHAACRDPEGRWWVAGIDERACDRAETLLTRAADAPPAPGPSTELEPQPAWPTIDRTTHAGTAVHQIKEWIAAGDVYQINLTLHVAAPWDGSPRALADALFGASAGATHAAFLHAPGATIASISPETFLTSEGPRVRTRPIKGTRRRGDDDAEDGVLAAALQAAMKDRAEHVMIVDLERNDLGRVCEIGTVRVPELMALEAHPTVWHLTSTVEGTLRPEVTLLELLAGTFPCGSVTGAPKRMAVERTLQLEPWRRGVYCGGVGVIGHGLVDLSVAIRTAVMHSGQAWYGTGGGIVADSDADEEWEETIAKARAFFTATGTTPPGLRRRSTRPAPTP